MVVQDRWLREVGYKGAFYFSRKKPNTEEKRAASKAETKKKLTVTARWASGHDKNKPLGGWVNKDGEPGCSSGGGGTKRCKQGSHIGHDWIKARYKNCRDCGTNTHEKADSDNKNEPHTHWYCTCDC